jgi:GTP-binding protein HflX
MEFKIPRAILLDVVPRETPKTEIADRLAEAESLVKTFGGLVVVKSMQRRGTPDYKRFVGSGKIEEIKVLAKELGANVLVVNNQLKQRQIFELSEALRPDGIQVWDRIDLILKIFGKHARTAETKLEIELAAIRHMGPRIYGMGIELGRQGGSKNAKGQGETNTEMMKRHLKERSRTIIDQIEKYEGVRNQHRANRKRQGFKTASIVGYTNAGKTSLLNALTKRKEYADDKLFATLDTRVGKIWLPEANSEVLISDTIGFIQDLPPELLKAFTSTLSEAVDADLLLHVIDAADPKRDMKIKVVEDILTRLGLENTPKLYVFNKMDATRKRFGKGDIETEFETYKPQFVSAHKGTGLEELKLAIAKKINRFER